MTRSRSAGCRSRRAAAGAVVAVAVALVGCAANLSATDENASDPSAELSIYAAASLTAPFNELAEGFAAQHTGVEVHPVVFDGSATLATQIIEGAGADVFASADTANMARLAEAGLLAAEPSIFATNTMQIAVAPGNPLGILSLADLQNSELAVVLCTPQVPCGAAAHTLLDAAGADVTPASEEQNVTAVVTKVRLGEADAGLIYTTDILSSAGKIEGIKIPDARSAANDYTIAALDSATNPQVAAAFEQWVLSEPAQLILARHGFGVAG